MPPENSNKQSYKSLSKQQTQRKMNTKWKFYRTIRLDADCVLIRTNE